MSEKNQTALVCSFILNENSYQYACIIHGSVPKQSTFTTVTFAVTFGANLCDYGWL
ncbi:hypothetical protein N483_03880 [Pseudoalteromonas luteoviolacea NCIMB 1944]|nr:hypothetical protein N483_03880 [Pseudoalteromonas luteoviolacea NCIMB 1944]